jgi:hypothetical protein
LKEIGFFNFAKPDVHLKRIFTELHLSATADDYRVFKAIIRVAQHAGVTPFRVDKLFWLIGSGRFHLDNIELPSYRDEFIAQAKERLQQISDPHIATQ